MEYYYSDGWKIVCTLDQGVMIENVDTKEQVIVTHEQAKAIKDEMKAVLLMMSVGGII